MRLTGDRLFTNISDTGKAFTIILLTDIFLGYVVLLYNLNLLTSSKPQISDSLVFFLDPHETFQKWPTGTVMKSVTVDGGHSFWIKMF
jgi:hypothetical protein